jgi:hypothetical protein
MEETIATSPKTVTFKLPENLTVDVTLPSMPDSRVTLRKDMTANEQEKIMNSVDGDEMKSMTNVRATLIGISAAFVSWNLVDEAGAPLQCNEAILRKFLWSDIAAIMQGITGVPMVDTKGNFLVQTKLGNNPSRAA